MSAEPRFEKAATGGESRLRAVGSWTTDHADALERLAGGFSPPAGAGSTIDVAGIERLDTFGAWVIERLTRTSQTAGGEVTLVDIPERYRGLLEEVHHAVRKPAAPSRQRTDVLARLDRLGRSVVAFLADLGSLLAMAGALAVALVRAIAQPRRLRPTSVVHHLDRVGWQAIGIILLMTFLVGAIIAQQGIFNFRRFGAQDYVVNLVGILVLREIGVLIVAIMVAGRSGSSYTAELGSMKIGRAHV